MHPRSPDANSPLPVGSSARDGRDADLVQALVEQLAAGQLEALYGLQSTAAELRRRTTQLQEAAAELPGRLVPHLESLVEGMAAETLSATTEQARALHEQLATTGQELAALSQAVTEAATTVSQQVLGGLRELLEERDRREAQLEARLNARVDRLTKKTETTINRLIGELADEVDLLRLRDADDRASAALVLKELLDQLLSLPRGKLKALRATVHDTQQENGA